MAFEPLEYSIEDGRPIYFYRFSLNDNFWRYTSADADIARNEVTWTAIPVADDGPNQTGEAVQDALRITISTEAVPAQLYMQYPPARPVQVAIFIGHEGDNQMRAIYQGEITQANVPQPGTMIFTCETIASTMAREGLRLGWQRSCPYALYDPVTCRVNKEAFKATATVLGVNGNTVLLSSLPNPNFGGGFVEWTDEVRGIERRGIESQEDYVIVMFGTADGIVEGMELNCYPGCARTTSACASFNNLPNYGGIPAFQGKSPFDGTTVFY